jgi:hypothetical protein
MSGVVRPLAEVLTCLPVDGEGSGRTAGPPFELYSDVRLATQVDNRWPILLERLGGIAARSAELSEHAPRLGFLAQNLDWIRLNIAQAAGGTT